MALTDPASATQLNIVSLLGLLVFGIGYYFEVVADGQLQSYKQEKEKDKVYYKGKYLNSGVWTHTRHPNYFGNTCVWWGIWLVAVAIRLSMGTVADAVLVALWKTLNEGIADSPFSVVS